MSSASRTVAAVSLVLAEMPLASPAQLTSGLPDGCRRTKPCQWCAIGGAEPAQKMPAHQNQQIGSVKRQRSVLPPSP